jgi:small conductance mechanosensitive channel
VDVAVDSTEDIDRALEACHRAADSMNQDPDWSARMLEPVQVWGVETLTGHDANIRLVVRGRPGGDVAQVARELRRRLLMTFVEAGFAGRRQMAILTPTPTPAGTTDPAAFPHAPEESGPESGTGTGGSSWR